MKKIAIMLVFAGIVWAGYSQRTVEPKPVSSEATLQTSSDGINQQLTDNLVTLVFPSETSYDFQFAIPISYSITITCEFGGSGPGVDHLSDGGPYPRNYGEQVRITGVYPQTDGTYRFIF